ncbi:L domain-like protein [Lentinus tigrinus ALCF2SS1-7]|uniref:L domain-like protein n=1 Tax=Lentinus tigrinus ALCF2SS1-6 TaxID=1328759 RepID=A0A5C2S2E7_9APHY|nr:L domain-like protein [Lentinus tigrinus ALCF2SS1-6]RPD78834.1 L domain-like protein [Lentinus tigrinus ALCF2SS1-7]
MTLDTEPGDEYVRRTAEHIRTHEAGLAAAVPVRRRRTKAAPSSEISVLNPLGWFSSDPSAVSNAKPVVLAYDYHHLFYLLMRMEALGLEVGSLDIKMDSPARPMNYIELPTNGDRSDALSFVSLRSSFSAVSRLSLGVGWFGRPAPPSLDSELKYIYSCFTKVPALALHAPESKLIAELANDTPNENALPMDAFKNLQSLQCTDIDPRMLLGWDRLSGSLRSLTVKRSGMEDVSDIFIAAVKDDQARREGRVSSLKSRKLSHGVSRQSSFHSTKLPESVPEGNEDAEDEVDAPPSSPDTPKPLPSNALPSLSWAFLRHLSLADNALTFLPTSFLPYLTSLTHLDLSSNLLVSVPPGLSALYNLIYLNLSDNMIDSVLGIYTNLGGVLTLNLSHNRLESICGLERLYALERVDLRHNLIEESAEVGRLATLPNIVEVSVEGNPLVEFEEGYRIRCFDFFWKEKKNILLDGSPPGFYEKRYLTSPPPEQMTSSRPQSVAVSPPIVAVGSPSKINGSAPAPAQSSPLHSSPTSSPASHPTSPHLAAGPVRGRKKKNKRIVDLDGGQESSEASSRPEPSRTVSPVKRSAVPEQTPAPTPTQAPPPPSSFTTSTVPAAQVIAVVKPKSRHSRHMTEFAPSSTSSDLSDGFTPSIPERPLAHRKSSTLSRAQMRRARVSASVYEQSKEEGDRQFQEADAFRARIEALRSDMGEGWLKVFNQSQLGSPPSRASQPP